MASAHRAAGASAASGRLVQPRWVTVGRVARYLGAAALVGVGVDHIWQFYVDSYSVIPTIGTLFALNFASALVVALGLVVPLQRLSPRWGRTLLAGLEGRETTRLFGFMESGYRGAIVLSIALDAAALILLSTFLGAGWRSRPPGARRPARAQRSR